MIDHDKGDDIFDVSCDYCSAGTYSTSAAEGWARLIDKIKKLGWKISKIGDEWKHMCPDCVAEGKKP